MENLDQIFDLLSEERRRYALYYLEQQDTPVPVNDLAEQVAEWEADDASEAIPEEEYNQIRVDLRHRDLPKASELQYIRYDREAGFIELTDAPAEVEAVLHIAKVIERPDRNP